MEMMNTTKISGVGAVADVVYPESTCWSLVLANYEVTCVGDSWAGLSRTRVKTRLISCLEVAYTTIHQYILLLLFRRNECLEVVFLGSLKSYHAC